MEDKGCLRTGSKVSEIANKFQTKVPYHSEITMKFQEKISAVSPDLLDDIAGVTIMRTESHVTRFNNARALFEKLGEENRTSNEKMAPPLSTKRTHSETKSKGESTRRENEDCCQKTSGYSSPSERIVKNDVSDNLPVLNDHVNSMNKTNGIKSNNSNENVIKTGERTKSNSSIKIEKPDKPEKPQRKFNSKELIDKQRNWTSHFSKPKIIHYKTEASKSEAKSVLNDYEKDSNNQFPSPSEFLNNPMTLLCEQPSSTNSRRINCVRKERPASVPTFATNIDNTNGNPSKRVFNKVSDRSEKAASWVLTTFDSGYEDVPKPQPHVVPDENMIGGGNEETNLQKMDPHTATANELIIINTHTRSVEVFCSAIEKQEEENSEKLHISRSVNYWSIRRFA